jgi:hypothetical protein
LSLFVKSAMYSEAFCLFLASICKCMKLSPFTYIASWLRKACDFLIQEGNLVVCILNVVFKLFVLFALGLEKLVISQKIVTSLSYCSSFTVACSFSFSSWLLARDSSLYLNIYLSSSISARAVTRVCFDYSTRAIEVGCTS